MIFGDWNLSSIEWQQETSGSLTPIDYQVNDINGINSIVVQELNCFGLLQYNHIRNHNNRILDLVLSDLPSDRSLVRNAHSTLPRLQCTFNNFIGAQQRNAYARVFDK